MKQVMGQKGLGPMTKLVRGFTLNSGWETWELMGEGEDEIRSWTGQPFNHSQQQRSQALPMLFKLYSYLNLT